jgi:hypothetical protein
MRKLLEEPVGVEASKLVVGDRQKDYGDPLDNLETIAKGWSTIIGAEVTGRQVSLCMIWLKICRDNNGGAGRDNEVDICGYAHLLQFDRESKLGTIAQPVERSRRKRRTKAEIEADRENAMRDAAEAALDAPDVELGPFATSMEAHV